MPRGFLAVLSEPGEVGIGEFHDWYDNEHIPLRLNHISAFLTGARFKATDEKKPTWLALYDIDSTSTFSDPSYTRLRENRSPREADLVKRLDLLDRRTCEVVFENKNTNANGRNTGLALGNPTKWVVTHGLDIVASEYREESEILVETWKVIATVGMSVNGVLRSRLFRCIDGLKSGVTVSSDPEAQKFPGYFVLHELDSRTGAELLMNGLRKLMENENTPFQILEEREWEIYRAYPCIAQGNLK